MRSLISKTVVSMLNKHGIILLFSWVCNAYHKHFATCKYVP